MTPGFSNHRCPADLLLEGIFIFTSDISGVLFYYSSGPDFRAMLCGVSLRRGHGRYFWRNRQSSLCSRVNYTVWNCFVNSLPSIVYVMRREFKTWYRQILLAKQTKLIVQSCKLYCVELFRKFSTFDCLRPKFGVSAKVITVTTYARSFFLLFL